MLTFMHPPLAIVVALGQLSQPSGNDSTDRGGDPGAIRQQSVTKSVEMSLDAAGTSALRHVCDHTSVKNYQGQETRSNYSAQNDKFVSLTAVEPVDSENTAWNAPLGRGLAGASN